MPEGPIGFDREFANAILELKLEHGKEVPLGRDQEFTDLYIANIKDTDFLSTRNVNIDVSTRELNPDQRISDPLGMPIEEVGILDIKIEEPDNITINEIENFTDTLSSIVFDSFRTLSIDTNKLVKITGDIIAKVNGPLGGPRPFVNSEIVFEAIYGDYIVGLNTNPYEQKDVELKIERTFEEVLEKRVDSFAMENTMKINFRNNRINTSKLGSIKAIVRDLGRDEGIALQKVFVTANGGEF